MKKKTEEKKKFDLEEAFVLWLNKSKESKKEYLTGKDLNDSKLIGFFNENKSNEKQPDIELYQINKDGKKGDKVVSLWENESKEGKIYLTGLTNENEKLVGFYGDKKEEKRPYIKGYFKEEN